MSPIQPYTHIQHQHPLSPNEQWRSRFGRRRPFIAFGIFLSTCGILTAGLSLLVLPAERRLARVGAVVLGYATAMVAQNAYMGPIRALVGVCWCPVRECMWNEIFGTGVRLVV